MIKIIKEHKQRCYKNSLNSIISVNPLSTKIYNLNQCDSCRLKDNQLKWRTTWRRHESWRETTRKSHKTL